MAGINTSRLGSALVEQGYLTEARLKEALAEQKRTGRRLGQVLVDNNYVSDEQIAKTIAAQQGIPVIDLGHFDVSPEVVQLLSEVQARRFRSLVLEDRGDSYLLGMVEPSNLRTQDELSSILGRPLDICGISLDHFNKTIDRIYCKTEQLGEYADEVKLDIEREGLVVDLNQMVVSIGDADAPVVKLLQSMFEDAVQKRASDIHIEPQENRLIIRFRIDGSLHNEIEADLKIASALLVRLKLMAGMDIAEKRLPQDGHITVKTASKRIDIRMSTVPTQYGESVVMRLLIQGKGLLDLKQLGLPKDLHSKFSSMIKQPHGIVLVTGPTGSGKTTTLYAALGELNQPTVKILTIEDPVEYLIPGINQVQVYEKIGLTFSRMLRSFLRQDPDIMLVGEIRDEETAQIAARAAMTGHLVLSTLHTNDAISTPVRLLDMGVPGYMIASTLLGVVSQRLLRVICEYCSEPYQPNHEELDWANRLLGDEIAQAQFRHGKGCARCNGIGYYGRIGVFELLEMTPVLSSAIYKADPVQFERMAREQLGKETLERHALELMLKGQTTVAEAMTVIASVAI